MAQVDDCETDHVPPLRSTVRRSSSKYGGSSSEDEDPAKKSHKFHLGSDTLETNSNHHPPAQSHPLSASNNRPLTESWKDTIRRISSGESLHAVFHRNQSHVSFHEPDSMGERKMTSVHQRSQSRTPSLAEIETEINDRAGYLQRSCSSAAFHVGISEVREDARVFLYILRKL